MSQNGRHRKWSGAGKPRIVLGAMQPGVEVSDYCRRDGSMQCSSTSGRGNAILGASPFRSQGYYGHLTLRNLAVLAEERGDRLEAVRLWRSVLAECPKDDDGHAALRRLGLGIV